MAGYCEHDDEPSGSIKEEQFLDKLNDCQLPKDSASWCSLISYVLAS
jgi:hypothetical protein